MLLAQRFVTSHDVRQYHLLCRAAVTTPEKAALLEEQFRTVAERRIHTGKRNVKLEASNGEDGVALAKPFFCKWLVKAHVLNFTAVLEHMETKP